MFSVTMVYFAGHEKHLQLCIEQVVIRSTSKLPGLPEHSTFTASFQASRQNCHEVPFPRAQQLKACGYNKFAIS